MSDSAPPAIRRHRSIGLAILVAVTLFVAASAAGLVWPRYEPPAKEIVGFEVGAQLAPAAGAQIAALADDLLDAPQTIAVVTGHTGAQGDPQANLALSAERARAVRDALVAAGIPADRIVTRGAGGTVALERREGESDAALSERSRRAEIRIVERRLLAGQGN